MKRFLVDALLVLVLVSLASYINEPKEPTSIKEQISQFEDEVARHEPITQKVETSHLNEIHENRASQMAQQGSALVIDLMETSMDVVSQLVQGFFN